MSMFINNTKVFQKSIIIEENLVPEVEWVADTCHDQQASFQYNQETRIALSIIQELSCMLIS